MELFILIVIFLSAYLIGAIPTAVWVGRIFYKTDIRHHGSKNAGATNTFRVLGYRAGVPVLLFDVFKGWAAVNLSFFSNYFDYSTTAFLNFQLALAIIAVLGHVFPVYVGFKGGKGVSTLLGAFMTIMFYPAIISLGVFVSILLITRYVSLSSIAAGISLPVFVSTIFRPDSIAIIISAILISLMIIITHWNNIKRLLKGEEPKANLFSRK